VPTAKEWTIPCHRYKTRANSKRMDNEVQESMKANIDQLKTQMGQMFEMMVALKDAVIVCNEEAQSSHPPLLQHSNLNGEIETLVNLIHMVCP